MALNLGLNGDFQSPGWSKSVQNYGQGVFSSNDVGNADFLANQTVSHSYAIYPYSDKTHEYVQEGMLVFVSRHTDVRYRLYNMAPIFKMNILQTEAFIETKLSTTTDATTFKRLLANYGEKVLEEYHCALKNGIEVQSADMNAFYKLAQRQEFMYLTKFGILQHWNFGGSVISKGEAMGSLEHHQIIDTTYVVGLACSERARTSNLWGHVFPGDKLYVMLTRESKDTPLVWVPFTSRDHVTNKSYTDASGRTCNAYIVYVGLVTEAIERDPTTVQIEQALAINGKNAKDAHEAYGSLPNIIAQIRI
jgi:hypothetical protein